jgi:hypothetical protein
MDLHTTNLLRFLLFNNKKYDNVCVFLIAFLCNDEIIVQKALVFRIKIRGGILLPVMFITSTKVSFSLPVSFLPFFGSEKTYTG